MKNLVKVKQKYARHSTLHQHYFCLLIYLQNLVNEIIIDDQIVTFHNYHTVKGR